MYGNLYDGEQTHVGVSEGFSSRQPNARSSFVRGNLHDDDGLIHRESFVGNYVKPTLLYLGKSTAAR